MMNLKKLFVVGAALLITSATAHAELVNGVRQRPNVTQTENYQPGVVCYLFNTKARLFLAGGNDWGTRASVTETGWRLKIVDEEIEYGSIEIVDSVEAGNSKGQWLNVWSTADGGAIWMDNNTETYRFWQIVEQTSGVYRFTNNTLAETVSELSGKCLGWKGVETDTRMYFVDPADEDAGVDWVFVSEETYQAWQEAWKPMKDQFNAAADLLTYLKAAKEQDLNVDTEQAVYENEAATVDELKAAANAVQAKINNQGAGNATVDNPADMTGSLMNPNFNGRSTEGWKGSKPGFGNSPHPAAEVAEFYNTTFNMYQDLKNMPAGVYMFTANAFNRGAWEGHADKKDYVVSLYAEADNDTMKVAVMNAWDAMNTESIAGDTGFGTTCEEEKQTHDGEDYYIPSDPSGARVMFERGFYLNNLYFTVDADTIRIGIRKDKKVFDWDWECMDNFKLTYFGQAAEAYQFYLEKSSPVKEEYSIENVSKQYIDAYDAAYAMTASNKAEAKAALKAISAANDSIAKNISQWAILQTKYDEGMNVCARYSNMFAASDLGDYLSDVADMLDASDKEGDYDLSNAALQAILDKIDELVEAVINEAKDKLEPGTDVTEYIKNAGFEEKVGSDENVAADWTIVSNGGGNVLRGGNNANHCFEAWHSTDFDVYQEINNLPLGVYEVSVKGYVRYLDGDDAINKADQAPEEVPIYVYMNDSKTNLVSWLSCPKPESFYKYDKEAGTGVEGATYRKSDDDHAYPDNLIAASAAFAAGEYTQSAKCLVSEKGAVTRIGVKGKPSKAEFWPVFDDFSLVYLGYDVSVVKPLLEEQIAEAEQVRDMMTTKTAKTNYTTAMEEATTAFTGTDGLAMFKATGNLLKAVEAVKEGNKTWEDFNSYMTDYMAFVENVESALQNEASNLGITIMGLLEQSQLDKEEMDDYKLQIREMVLKIKLPENYEQGSAEGVDVTAFIQTPSFEKVVDGVTTNAIDGWQGAIDYKFGNDDTQKAALALEYYERTFDMYQDLTSVRTVTLPKGYYCLQVSAFERVNEKSPAYLYAAANGEVIASTELMDHAKGYDPEAGESGPGDMVSSVALFEAGRYLNQIKFRFDGDTLRIGIKHETNNGGDWVIMDNFKLYFYGQDGTGVATVVDLGKPVQVQYFTLDGRQVSAARKGLVIRKTVMDNGAVIVRKIQK